ncbi:choline binding protein G [Streptococcus pneumoniae]|nr:choline binding protein G [Streptococcus pneumoniae]
MENGIISIPLGAMVTGSQTIDGKVYNFASSGEWI